MKNIKKFNEYQLNESSESVLKEQMKDVAKRISVNITRGWIGNKLESAYDAAVLQSVDNSTEDEVDDIVYNNWAETLDELKYRPEIATILEKISANQIDFWTHDLEETFDCVILENVYWENDDGEQELEYNGWYEDIKRLAGLDY